MNRLLIANRGEIACRIIKAAKSTGLPTVAVFSEADRDLPHAAMADMAVYVGPANAQESYLNTENIIKAAIENGCTMVHPGYGFLSENAAFAQRCADAGLIFVGPAADHIDLMGDKQNARDAAIAAGVPVLPGTGRLPQTDDDIVSASKGIGYPMLVKAVAGGGGHGMQRIDSADKLLSVVKRIRDFAARVFGDAGVYLERCLTSAHHVEVQVFGFGTQGAVHLFERDCSLQRRHQKVIEEAPAPNVSDEARNRMTKAALSLANSIGYAGAGTVEYLYDPTTEKFFFLEMNTRIQVEHPVTETITGVDLVALQLTFAMSPDAAPLLRQHDIECSGAAIEARIYAENPEKRFLPSPGMIEQMVLPEMPRVRYDTGYINGNEVTIHYDPMIMKVIAQGETREDARKNLIAALRSMKIAGLTTNIPFLIGLLENDSFKNASFDINTIDLPSHNK